MNCSLFNPTPSLSAMVVNHFGMRPDIKSYNLSGMGCSAGIISIGLARELLQASTLGLLHACTLCLRVSTAAKQAHALLTCSVWQGHSLEAACASALVSLRQGLPFMAER